MRSPMMQNGRSKPITTSLLAELTTVSVMRITFPAPPLLDQGAERARVDSRPRASRPRHPPRPPDRRRRGSAVAAPLGEIGIGAAHAGAHRGAVDRLLEALGQLPLGGATAGLDDHLGGNVAPGDDDQLGHEVQPAWRRKSARLAVAGRPVLVGEAEPQGRRLRLALEVRIGGLGEIDQRRVVAEIERQQLGMAVEAEALDHQRSKCRARKSVR